MQARLRLRRRADFARVRAEGKSWRHRLAILSVAPRGDGAGGGSNRYGIITSRRIGKAVKRNRARRLLREVLRQNHPYIHAGYDIVLIARAAIVGRKFAEVNDAVQSLLKQAGLLALPDEQDAEETT